MVSTRATYTIAKPIWCKNGTGRTPSGNIKVPKPIYWIVDFHFPKLLASTTTPDEEATPRNPVTTISRQRMIRATQAGILPVGISMTRAVATKTLSAKGSIN